MQQLYEKIKKWLKSIQNAPVIGGMVDDVLTMAQLAGDYARGSYRAIPRATIFALTGALLYALSPIDLVLDILPFVGLLDDAAVIALILELGLAKDLGNYRRWKSRELGQAREAYRSDRAAYYLALIGPHLLAGAFLTDRRQVRLLLCEEGEQDRPVRCKAILDEPDLQRLSTLEIEEWEELGAFFSSVFQDDRFRWSHLGKRPFSPEYDAGISSEDYIVEP